MANAQAMDLDQNSTPADQENPWDASAATAKVLDPTDPSSQAAIRGYRMAVATGKVDPQDGVDRLKKAGIVHPTTQPADLLPTPNRSPAGAGPVQGPPSPATPYAGNSMGPWANATPSVAKLTDVNDPQYQAAIRGYQKAVSLPPNHPNYVDPQDGLNRLKKIGAVRPDTQVSDIAPPGIQTQLPTALKGATPSNASNISAPQNPTTAQGQPINPWQNFFNAGKTGDLSAVGNMAMMPMVKTGNSQTAIDTANQKTDQSEADTTSQKTDQSETDQTTNKTENLAKHTANIRKFDPEDYSLRLAQAQGHQINPVLDAQGNPTVDANGRNQYTVGALDPNSPFQKQSTGLDRIQNLLNMQAGMRANAPITSQMDLSPLMRLGEIMTGSKGDVDAYQKSSIAPESMRDMQQRLIANEQGIQNDRSKLQQSLFENMKSTQPTLTYADMMGLNTINGVNNTQKAATQNANTQVEKAGQTNTTGQTEKATNDTSTTVGNPASFMQAARLGQGQARMDMRGSMGAQQAVNKDTILNTYQQRIDGADKIMNLMNAADDGKVASTNAMLGQLNAETARLETGSQSPGIGAAEKTEMSNFAAQVSAVRDAFAGAQTPVDLHNAFKQARAMVTDLRQSYVQRANARVQFLGAGALPSQADTFGAKASALAAENAHAPKTVIPKPKGGPTAPPNPDLPGGTKTPPPGLTLDQFKAWKRANGL